MIVNVVNVFVKKNYIDDFIKITLEKGWQILILSLSGELHFL